MITGAPFDAIASSYDAQFTETQTGKLQRTVVHDFLEKIPFAHVLELNAGTGTDAVWMARRGAAVCCTDVSEAMVTTAREKAEREGLLRAIRFQVLDARTWPSWVAEEPLFDLVFSNFGGLNCLSPQQLSALAPHIDAALKPGCYFVAVVMGRFCWWETLYFLLKGKWASAFRRSKEGPVSAQLAEGVYIDTWYYSPHFFAAPWAKMRYQTQIRPVGIFLPPSYLDPFFAKKSRLLKMLDGLEKKCRGAFWASSADHYLICLQKKSG